MLHHFTSQASARPLCDFASSGHRNQETEDPVILACQDRTIHGPDLERSGGTARPNPRQQWEDLL
jgi:hypothetical protein